VYFAVLLFILAAVAVMMAPSRRQFAGSESLPDPHYESWHPPKGHTREPNDRDLAQLQAWLDDTNCRLYAGTFPRTKIAWAGHFGDAYAYAVNDQIRFVRSEFCPDWQGNRDVVLHEMAHLSTRRNHDILWDQERARLAEGRRIMTFEQVRRASQ